MKYIDLYYYLRNHEKLSRVQAIRSIITIRHLDPEIKKAMSEWSKTGTCDLTVAKVSFRELITKLGMKPVRAFKMLDWLKREPVIAHRYLAQKLMLADLSKYGSASIAGNIEETDKSDIVL